MSAVTYAVAYARVSKEDQAIKNLSVPAQFRRIEEYCQKNNIVIIYRDADEGVSAFKDNENREGFERAVDAACRDKAFQEQSNREKKKLLRYFIRRIEFSPDNDRLAVYLFADPTSTKAVWFSYGAQDRT